MSDIAKIILVYAFAILISLTSCHANAFDDYDVDWPPSNEKGVHTLRITIDNCSTIFKIKDKDFYNAAANEEAMKDALKKAISRAETGCK